MGDVDLGNELLKLFKLLFGALGQNGIGGLEYLHTGQGTAFLSVLGQKASDQWRNIVSTDVIKRKQVGGLGFWRWCQRRSVGDRGGGIGRGDRLCLGAGRLRGRSNGRGVAWEDGVTVRAQHALKEFIQLVIRYIGGVYREGTGRGGVNGQWGIGLLDVPAHKVADIGVLHLDRGSMGAGGDACGQGERCDGFSSEFQHG